MKWEEVVKTHDIRLMYQEAHLDKIIHLPQPMLDLAKRWVDSPRRPSLFLSGDVGKIGRAHV